METKRMDRLYSLLDTLPEGEAKAALRWAIYTLEQEYA